MRPGFEGAGARITCSSAPVTFSHANAKTLRNHERNIAADQIDYIAQLKQLPEITEGLLKRGYSEVDREGVLGENWLRAARDVWK